MNGYLNDPFLRGYLGAALRTGTDESDDSGGRPLDERFNVSDFSAETIETASRECAAFTMANLADLDQHPRPSDGSPALEYAGHNFWLSRCGHGSGFFDTEGLPEDVRERLQEASRAAGECYVYIGDDGELHISSSVAPELREEYREARRDAQGRDSRTWPVIIALLLFAVSVPTFAADAPCKVNVSSCKAAECSMLPGIGPTKGAAIEAAHPATEAELDAVDGIGEATLAKQADRPEEQGRRTVSVRRFILYHAGAALALWLALTAGRGVSRRCFY